VGNLEEALKVAERADMPDRFLSLLVRMGRMSDAHQYAFQHLSQAHDVLAIPRTLHEHGATQQDVQLGEHGVSLAGEVLARCE